MKRWLCMVLVISFSFASAVAKTPDYHWAVGISGIAPGLPIAAKGVWQSHGWGVQLEANYFYALGMLRLDARRIVAEKGRWGAYGFVGATVNHFNDGKDINNTLWADLGGAATVRLGKERHLELGFEGGLMIPVWSNRGLEQYEDTGFMVANVFALWWM